MNKIESETLQKSVEVTPVQGGIARRRLLRAGLVAAPLTMVVSGRSAMAGTACGDVKGLSPLAWASMAPKGACVGSSHTIEGNPLGKSPGYWTPNVGGNGGTFQPPYRWPVSPFDRVSTLIANPDVYAKKSWDEYPYLDFKGVKSTDEGFANGASFSGVFSGGSSSSFSRILIDQTASKNVEWHFCAAYLNCKALGGAYAMTLAELIYLWGNRKLVPGGVVLSDGEIKSFLDQTWG